MKTLYIGSLFIGSILLQFPITKTVENLTLNFDELVDARDLAFTLRKVFTVFPNTSSLCIKSNICSLEDSLNLEDWETLDGSERLKTFCAYLTLVSPSLALSSVARVIDQCVGLSEVSLLIHRRDVTRTASKTFMSECMARWPTLKWKWGIWSEEKEDSWITDGMSN